MTDCAFLRAEKRKALINWYESGFYKKDSLKYDTYENATILPLKKQSGETLQFGKGGVIVEHDYISCSGIEGRVGGYYPYESSDLLDQKVVYCGALIKQWGHFLVESVARLWYFLENDPTVDKYVFISNASHFEAKNRIYGNYRQFFELLGIWDKIDVVASPTTYREVVVPELGYSRKYYYSDQYKSVFDRVRENALKKSEKTTAFDRVFLSRSKLEKARKNEIGIDLLDDYFQRNGYEILYPESLSLTDMIGYLNRASVCAAESGTLPHNFLFCSDGKQVEIMERQTTINEIQTNIDQIKSLNVTYVDAHFTIYPTLAGWGPYFIAYTKQFSAFTKSRGYSPPDERFLTEKAIKKNLLSYMKEYKRSYGFEWGFEKWQLMYAKAYYEAYEESLDCLRDYLDCSKPLFLKDYFTVSYIKKSIKKCLCK